jgi:hypothetical protein
VLVITPDNPLHSCQPEFPDINLENENQIGVRKGDGEACCR